LADDLEVRGLGVRRASRGVLEGIEMCARAGEITCVLGPNGAGKSTLLRAIVGLLDYSGTVTLGGKDLRHMHARERARLLAYVPQRSVLEAPLSVEAVVAQGRFAHTGGLRAPSEIDRRAVARAMERTDVISIAGRAFDRLSTGERRRVLVARALATEARTILLDEPTAALDVRHALELYAILRELATDGFAIAIVIHALDDARRHTDRAVLLHQGRVVADGPSIEIVSEANVREVYGVELVEDGAAGFVLGGAR
jgi:iron complex transport system ATP-binding protein